MVSLRDHPMRVFGEPLESEAVKRKREEVRLAECDLELVKVKCRAKKMRMQHINESVEMVLEGMKKHGLSYQKCLSPSGRS